jgi:hypothetical protein
MEETLKLAVMVDPITFKDVTHGDTSTFYRLSFVTVNEKNEVRNVSNSYYGDESYLNGFHDLVFQVWISWSNNRFDADQWEVIYKQVYSVNLREAELMVKTLKRVQKISEKFVVRPQSFGQFVAMMCAGLKIKHFVEVQGADRGWHTENRYAIGDIKDLAANIDRKIEAARLVKVPAPAADKVSV